MKISGIDLDREHEEGGRTRDQGLIVHRRKPAHGLSDKTSFVSLPQCRRRELGIADPRPPARCRLFSIRRPADRATIVTERPEIRLQDSGDGMTPGILG